MTDGGGCRCTTVDIADDNTAYASSEVSARRLRASACICNALDMTLVTECGR